MGRRSGFLDLVGPLYVDETDSRAPVYGLRVGEQHTNNRGGFHGGAPGTLVDVALGYGSLAAPGETLVLVTANLTINFTGTAGVGDWLEARTTLKRVGSRLAFVGCEVTSDGRPVASGSGGVQRATGAAGGELTGRSGTSVTEMVVLQYRRLTGAGKGTMSP